MEAAEVGEGDLVGVDYRAPGGVVGEGEPGDFDDVVGAGDDELGLVAGGGVAGERGAEVGVLAVVEGAGGGDVEEEAVDADGEAGLFQHLAGDALLGGFASLDAAAGEEPVGVAVVGLEMADEEDFEAAVGKVAAADDGALVADGGAPGGGGRGGSGRGGHGGWGTHGIGCRMGRRVPVMDASGKSL